METKERIIFLDWLRVIACLLVIIVHASETFYGPEGNLIQSQDHRLWIGIWDSFSRISVPLFMICSAYLLLPLDEGKSWSDFFKRRFLRTVPPMFCFMVLYCLIPPLFGLITWEEALKMLVYTPMNFPTTAVHLWFMYPLLGMYMLIPILSPWLRTATARQERFFIAIWLASTCLPYINRWVGEVWGQCWWNQYDMLFSFSGYPGYLILAHYIKKHLHWERSRRLAIGFITLFVGWLATFLSFYLQAIPGTAASFIDIEIGWCFCTLNCVIFTFGAFLLFTCIEHPCQLYPIVRDVSKHSYGMYLMHMLWLTLWSSLLTPLMHISLAIPAMAICTYICSYLTTKLLSCIPGSKWLLG